MNKRQRATAQANRRRRGATKPPCPCCANHGVLPTSSSGVPGMVDGDVALLCCDPCMTALFLSGPEGARAHPHQLIRPEPHYHWPPADGHVEPCDEDLESYCTQTAVVDDHHDDDAMAYARQATHDSLVNGLGEHRASGIWWTHHHGDEALQVANDVLAVVGPEDAARVLEVRAKTIEHLEASDDATLVVAWCLALLPAGTAYDGEAAAGGRS